MLYISNFVLDLYNYNNNIMKTKAQLILILLGVVCLTACIWVYYSMKDSFTIADILQFGVLVLVAVFAVFLGIRQLQSERRGEPAKDELSKKILTKAAASAYYISLYLWLTIIVINDGKLVDPERIIGFGIIGMAILFALSWFYHRSRGIKD